MCLCVIVSTGTGYLLIEDEVQNCRVVSYTLQCVELCQTRPFSISRVFFHAHIQTYAYQAIS